MPVDAGTAVTDNGERMNVDLHIHSELSDGKYAPARVVEEAGKGGLGIIALTDHDTVDGVDEALAAGAQVPHIRVIRGVEFSTWLEDDELHILGYGINHTHPALRRLAHTAGQNRRQRVARMLDTLRTHNIRLGLEDVKNGFRSVCLGRLHVAHALRQRRYVTTIREAFERFLSYRTGILSLVPDDFIGAPEAIEAIREAGGIPVLAHPSIELFDRYLPRLLEAGLRGVEVFKTSRTAIEEYYFETVAHDKNLLLTGGSDWHGHRPTQKLGDFAVDASKVDRFLQALT